MIIIFIASFAMIIQTHLISMHTLAPSSEQVDKTNIFIKLEYDDKLESLDENISHNVNKIRSGRTDGTDYKIKDIHDISGKLQPRKKSNGNIESRNDRRDLSDDNQHYLTKKQFLEHNNALQNNYDIDATFLSKAESEYEEYEEPEKNNKKLKQNTIKNDTKKDSRSTDDESEWHESDTGHIQDRADIKHDDKNEHTDESDDTSATSDSSSTEWDDILIENTTKERTRENKIQPGPITPKRIATRNINVTAKVVIPLLNHNKYTNTTASFIRHITNRNINKRDDKYTSNTVSDENNNTPKKLFESEYFSSDIESHELLVIDKKSVSSKTVNEKKLRTPNDVNLFLKHKNNHTSLDKTMELNIPSKQIVKLHKRHYFKNLKNNNIKIKPREHLIPNELHSDVNEVVLKDLKRQRMLLPTVQSIHKNKENYQNTNKMHLKELKRHKKLLSIDKNKRQNVRQIHEHKEKLRNLEKTVLKQLKRHETILPIAKNNATILQQNRPFWKDVLINENKAKQLISRPTFLIKPREQNRIYDHNNITKKNQLSINAAVNKTILSLHNQNVDYDALIKKMTQSKLLHKLIDLLAVRLTNRIQERSKKSQGTERKRPKRLKEKNKATTYHGRSSDVREKELHENNIKTKHVILKHKLEELKRVRNKLKERDKTLEKQILELNRLKIIKQNSKLKKNNVSVKDSDNTVEKIEILV